MTRTGWGSRVLQSLLWMDGSDARFGYLEEGKGSAKGTLGTSSTGRDAMKAQGRIPTVGAGSGVEEAAAASSS